VHDLAEDRVEEGLRQLRLLVIGQQPDVEQLGPLPGDVVDRFRAKRIMQQDSRLVNAIVVEGDALAHRDLHRPPVAGFEALLGQGAAIRGTGGNAC
jgi:hypothetical protein